MGDKSYAIHPPEAGILIQVALCLLTDFCWCANRRKNREPYIGLQIPPVLKVLNTELIFGKDKVKKRYKIWGESFKIVSGFTTLESISKTSFQVKYEYKYERTRKI